MNSENSRAVAARWAGAAALTGLASVVVVQAGAIIIAGQRVSGTSDADEIGAYFAHPSLQWVYLVGGAGFVAILVLAVALRRYLHGARNDPTAYILADAAAALLIAEVAVGFTAADLRSEAAPDLVVLTNTTFGGTTGQWLITGVHLTTRRALPQAPQPRTRSGSPVDGQEDRLCEVLSLRSGKGSTRRYGYECRATVVLRTRDCCRDRSRYSSGCAGCSERVRRSWTDGGDVRPKPRRAAFKPSASDMHMRTELHLPLLNGHHDVRQLRCHGAPHAGYGLLLGSPSLRDP